MFILFSFILLFFGALFLLIPLLSAPNISKDDAIVYMMVIIGTFFVIISFASRDYDNTIATNKLNEQLQQCMSTNESKELLQ